MRSGNYLRIQGINGILLKCVLNIYHFVDSTYQALDMDQWSARHKGDIIKTFLKEILYHFVDWKYLAVDRDE